ncbi:MAG TPA: hypothetical protein VFS07_07445 [Gemmatimonadales bacterium]|nr:hypothetical protein [Gemmatimonadales bacterium]
MTTTATPPARAADPTLPWISFIARLPYRVAWRSVNPVHFPAIMVRSVLRRTGDEHLAYEEIEDSAPELVGMSLGLAVRATE